MRTLTQQVYEDHAAACSRAAEQTDDPVFRRMLTVETGRAARGEAGNLLLLGTAEGFRPVSTLLYAMAGRQALVKAKRPRAARRLRRRRWKRIERKEGPAKIGVLQEKLGQVVGQSQGGLLLQSNVARNSTIS